MYSDLDEWMNKINEVIPLNHEEWNEIKHLLSEFHTQSYEEGYENAKEIFTKE